MGEPGAIKVKGWGAIAIILVALSIWGATRWRAYTTLDTKAVETLRPWLVAAHARDASGGKPISELTPEEREKLAERVMAAEKLEIVSIKARGSGESIVCRVEYLIDGNPPTDGSSPRYFRMKYSNLLGWTYYGECRALGYYVRLF